MVNYELLVQETKEFIEKFCCDIENMNANEDVKNILDITTTEWGYVHTLCDVLDDLGASIIGDVLQARIVAAHAIADAKD